MRPSHTVFRRLFCKMATIYTTYILFFFHPVTCYKATLGKQCSLPGLSIRARLSSTRARCGSWDADYVCLVYKCSSEQIPHFLAFLFLFSFFFFLFFLVLPLPCIYIHRLSFWHKQQTKNILVLSYERLLFVRKCRSGPWFMAAIQRCSCLYEPIQIACLLRRKSTAEISEWQLKSMEMTPFPIMSFWGQRGTASSNCWQNQAELSESIHNTVICT